MHYKSLLILSTLALTALSAPLSAKKKDPKIILLDLNDADIHYPNGTISRADGTIIEPEGTVRDGNILYEGNIPTYPSGGPCEPEAPFDDPFKDVNLWYKWCEKREFLPFPSGLDDDDHNHVVL